MPEKDPTTWTVLDCGSDAAWRRALSVLKWLMLLPLKLVAMLLAVLLQTWPGAWQVKAQLFYTPTRFVRINLGWKSVSNRTRLIYTNHLNPFRSWKAVQ